jgi:pilus assembly protein Flp/PilA
VLSGAEDGSTSGLHGCAENKRPIGTQDAKRKGQIMKALVYRMREFLVNEDGPTATEYAVMLALIIVVCVAAVGILGRTVRDVFTSTNTSLTNETGGGA